MYHLLSKTIRSPSDIDMRLRPFYKSFEMKPLFIMTSEPTF
jgi:hypothetical protein